MKELTTFLVLNEHGTVTYCILSLLNQSNEVNIKVRIGNTSFIPEVPICSVRQDLTKSWYTLSVVINERELNKLVAYLLWVYFKKYICFKISYSL